MNNNERQMSESFRVAILLSISGGFQDAYTYLSRGKVFANAQTGNIVLLSQSLFTLNFPQAIHYLIPLVSFALGVAASEIIRHHFMNSTKIHWRQLVLLCEILLLFPVGFIPESLNTLANAAVSFACAMQVQAFRKVKGYPYSSTMCIGNIRSGMESFCAFFITHNKQEIIKAAHYFGIIFFFAFGAGIGALLLTITIFGTKTIWVSCILLLSGICLMSDKSKRITIL